MVVWRGRRAALAAAAALLGLVAAGCGSGQPIPETGRVDTTTHTTSTSTTGGIVSPSRDEVRTAMRGFLAQLSTQGMTPAFANGEYVMCSDNGADWAYDASARLNVPASTKRPLKPRVERLLFEAGWDVRHDSLDTSRRSMVQAHKGALAVTFNEYGGQDFVLFDIHGPCLPKAQQHVAAIETHGQEPIPVT